MGYVITVMIAYLMGSSNLAFYIAKLRGKDLRGAGSGNYGASNATILLGWRIGVAVGIHDIGKAILAVLLAQYFFPGLPNIGAVAGAACVLGHIFPFYLCFKGGKGFASFIGMTIALNWKLAILVILAVLIVTVITDYIVVGTVTTVVSVPIGMGVLTHSILPPLIILIATAAILWKHRENYTRIRNRQEIGLRSAIRGDNKL